MKLNKIKIIICSIFLFSLSVIFYLKNHEEIIFKNLGEYYYKKNDIPKSIAYFEKAFEKGVNDSKLREIYVNSIINSPLTIENQEKLVTILKDNNDDTASKTAEYFLYNLKREIHNKYPQNYVLQAPYNGKIVHWGKFPITFAFKNIQGVPKEYLEEIENAFNEWERASSCRVTFSKENFVNADIIVEFINPKQEKMEYGRKYVIAYTTPDISQNRLKGMNIKFNLHNQEGDLYSRNQIYNTALHEVFHALGFMGHSFDIDDIMYMSKDSNSLQKDERDSLSEADKSTLELLYKIKPDITNDNEHTYEYISYMVLGNDENVNFSKKIEAKNYIYNAPTLPGGYIDLAESFSKEEKYPDAIRNLEKALRLSTDNDTKFIVYYNLAVSYFKIGHYEMAYDYVKRAEEFNNTEDLELLLAEIYLKSEQEEKAIKQYSMLQDKYPKNIDYALILANIYIKNHNYVEARKVIKKYMNANPQDKNNKRLRPYGILRW